MAPQYCSHHEYYSGKLCICEYRLKIWDNKYPDVDVFPWLLLSDLKTALVQGDDFSSGTSSRSTKLIHGGVRYLQKAIMKLDYKQVNASFFLRS